MIYAITGILEQINIENIIIKAGSFSFVVNVSNTTLKKIGSIGKSVYLFTHIYIRDDNVSIYGFMSEAELKIFKKLIGISGIGPKHALGLLSFCDSEQLISAIINNDLDLLSRAPGIGKKTAARIILELKTKLDKEDIGLLPSVVSDANNDLISALTGLGYSFREANEAASSIPDSQDLTIENKIKIALQNLASK